MKTRRTAMKNTRRISICATSIAAFMAATPESPGVNYNVLLGDTFLEPSVVTGATGLVKTGGGSLILQNAGNNYTGTTTISNGAVVISAASALGSDASEIIVTGFNPTIGQVTNLRGFGGGSLVLSGLGGGITIARNLSLQGQGPIADRNGALVSIGDNTLSGTVTTAPLAFGLTPIATTIISAAGTLNLTGGLVVQPLGAALATVTTLGGNNQGGVTNYNLTGALSGVGILSKAGGGALLLNPSTSTGFSGSIRTNGGNASGQSSVRITAPNVLGTRTAGGVNAVLDLNGGILEVLMDTPSVLQAGTGAANVYLRTASTIFVDKSLGDSSAMNGTLALSQLAFEENQTLSLNSRNGYGITFGAAPVQGGNASSTFNNNLQGGLLTFTGNFWSNTDNGANRTFTLAGNGNTLIDGNIVASSAAFDHSFTKTGTGTLTVTGTGTTLDGSFNVNGGTVETNRIVTGLVGAASTAAAAVNIGTGATTATLTFLGAAGSGAGETVAKTINLAGTTGGARINANQTGSAASALVLESISVANNTNKTLTLGGTSNLRNEITGAITNPGSGALSLVKTDPGTWVLSGVNTYTGSTTISSGTLRLKANAVPTSTVLDDASQIIFNADAQQAAGGRLVLEGVTGVATTEAIGQVNMVNGHGTIRVENAGATTTLAAAGFVPASSSLGASINFEAPTAQDVVTMAGTVDTIPRGNAYYNGANFAYIGTGNVLRAPNYGVDPLTASSAVALTAGQHNLVTGSFSDAGTAISSLKFSGSQTLTLTGTAAVNLGFQTSGGILVDGGNAVIAQGGGGAITQGLGAAANGGGALVIRVNQASDSLALQVPITSSTTQGVAKNGLGTLILSAANAQAGVTNINEGTIQLATGGRLSAANQNLVIRQGATLDLNGVSQPNTTIGALNGAGTVTNSNATAAEFAFGNNGQAGTFSGLIQDGAGRINVLKQSTAGPLLTGLNTYTGTTTITSTGLINVTNLANIGSPSGIGAGDVGNNAGSLVFTGAQVVAAATGLSLPGGLTYSGTENVSTNRLFTLGGTAAGAGARLTASGVNNVGMLFSNTGPIAYTAAGATVAQNLVLAGASTADNRINSLLQDSGAVGGSLRVNKIDAGKWVLGNNSNSYTGATKINGGALEVTATSLPTTSALLFGGTLAIPTGGVLEASGTFTRALSASTTANTVNFNANGNFAGSGGFASSGNKLTVNLGGASAPLTWGGGGFLMAGSAAATLRLNSTTAVGEVDFQNPIDLGALGRTVQIDDNANIATDFATLSGALSGVGGSLSKTGAGTLYLTGANTYTGTTTINQGTIVVRSLGNSSSPGASSVGDSAAGTTTGAVLLGNGNTTGGILQYIGAGETSDRLIRLNTTTAQNQIHADGSGALILTNVLNNVDTGAKNLALRGTSIAGNRIDSILTDSPIGAGTAALPLSVTIDGSATWILNAANTYSGNTAANAGALGLGNDAALGSGTLVLNNSNLFASGGDRSIANAAQLVNNTTQGFMGDNSLTFTSPFQILAAANNVGINNNIAAGESLNFTGGATLANLTANRVLTVDGPGQTVFGNINNTSTTAFGLSITKTGTGTLVLNGAAGNFTQNNNTLDIDNGTVRLGAANALLGTATGAANVTFSPDNGQAETALLNLNGFSQTVNALTATSTSSSTIDNASGTAVTLTVGAQNGAVNYNGAITATGGGAISIVKAGTAAGVLSGSSIAIGGTTSVQGGSLAFSAADPVNTTGITVAGGASLSLINGTGSAFSSLASLNLGAGAGTAALGLDVGTITDTLAIASPASTAGTVNFSIGAAPGFGSSPNYTLLSAASGLSGATYALNGVVPGGFIYTINATDTVVSLGLTAAAPSGPFYWRGDLNNSFSAYVGSGLTADTNFEDAGGANKPSIPGASDVVIFNAVAAPLLAGPNVSVTLDNAVSVNKIEFNGSDTSTAAANVTIAPGVGGTLTIGSGGIELPDTAGNASISAPVTLAADQTWLVGSLGNAVGLSVSGPISGTGSLTKTGAGTATLTGVNTFTGKTAINNGTLRVNSEAALGAPAAAVDALFIGTIDLDPANAPATLRSTAAFTIDDAGRGITIGTNGGVIDTTGGNITVEAGNVVAGGPLLKAGGSTLILNAANTYASTFVNGGAVRAGNNTALGAGAVTLGNTGTILELADGVTVANAITISDTGNDKTIRLLAGASTGTVTGAITSTELAGGNLRAQASGAGVLTIQGAITAISPAGTAAPALRINEAAGNTGTVVLAGANSYVGSTEVRQGTLRNGANEVIPGAVVVNASVAASPSATYDLGGFSETVTGLTYGAAGSSNAAYVNTVTTGAGTLTLAGNVTTNVNPPGNQNIQAVLAGNVAMTAVRTFTVANAANQATDLLITAAITGTGGGIAKAGAGTLELAGASNYTGATTVAAGTLLVTGSITGATTTTAAAGTLAGTGTVGAVTGTLGTIAPGNAGIGTLTATSLTMTGATLALEINTQAQTIDLLNTSSPLSLALAGSPLTITDLGGNQPLLVGTTLPFLTYSGAQTGFFSIGGNQIDDDTEFFNIGVNTFALNYNLGGNSVALVVVPEPGIAASLLGGFGMLVGLQRIRRRSDRRA